MNLYVHKLPVPWASSPAHNDDRPENDDQNDLLLLERSGHGDKAAFSRLIHRHTPSLYRVAWRMLGQKADAEDVVQESFARLWLRAPQWQSRGAGPVAWLHRVAINQCYDRLRVSASRWAEVSDELVDNSAGPDDVLARSQASRLVDSALQSLPERSRAALVLSYYEGFPNQLVADIMDLNIKAFESLLLRSRRQMRKTLERQGLYWADLQVAS